MPTKIPPAVAPSGTAAPASPPTREIDPLEWELGMGKLCAALGEREASRDPACIALISPGSRAGVSEALRRPAPTSPLKATTRPVR